MRRTGNSGKRRGRTRREQREPLRYRRRPTRRRHCRMGNEQIGAVVAMMLVAARCGVAWFLVAFGRIGVMNGRMTAPSMTDTDEAVAAAHHTVRHPSGMLQD